MLTETRTAAARAVDLRKVFGEGSAAVEALRGVSIEFAAGEYTAIMGASGSGKSTLLHCMAGLDKPTSGTVWIGDKDLTHLKDRDLTELRRDRVGFVFQAYNLVPTLTAAREHHAAQRHRGPRRGPGALRRGRRHDRAPRPPDATSPRSCRAGSSSGSRRLVPSSPGPRSCSRTSPRGTSTRARPRSCSPSSRPP